jgi:hypothetical protein
VDVLVGYVSLGSSPVVCEELLQDGGPMMQAARTLVALTLLALLTSKAYREDV